jgi:hypothetical protein
MFGWCFLSSRHHDHDPSYCTVDGSRSGQRSLFFPFSGFVRWAAFSLLTFRSIFPGPGLGPFKADRNKPNHPSSADPSLRSLLLLRAPGLGDVSNIV